MREHQPCLSCFCHRRGTHPPPSSAHPLGRALEESPADHLSQERAGSLMLHYIYLMHISLPFQVPAQAPAGDRQQGGGCPCPAPRLPALGALPEEGGAGGISKAFCSPRNCAGKQSKTKQTLSFSPKQPGLRTAAAGGAAQAIFRDSRCAQPPRPRAERGRGLGAGGPQRAKYARCFPVMHLARCLRRMREE